MNWPKGRGPILRRCLFRLILSLILISCLYAGDRRLTFKLTGGLSRSSLGDVNSYLQGYSRFEGDDLGEYGFTQDKAFETYHFGSDFQVEVVVPLTDRLSVCAGFGYIQAQKKQNTLSQYAPYNTLTITLDHEVRTFPITAALDWAWPIAPKWAVHIEAGAGVYLSRFRENGERLFTYDYESWELSRTKTWEAEASASGLGVFGGIGLEAEVARNLSLLVEAGFRRAKISGFSGNEQVRFDDLESEGAFDLFYYEFYSSASQHTYPALNLPDAGSADTLKVFRDGAIDLAGWTLKAGLKISL